MSFEDFLIDFHKVKETQKSFVVVTLVGHQGSVPQVIGARLIVSEEGYFSGTIGGGKLEKAAVEKSLTYLNSSENFSSFQEWNLQTDLGMSCGGVAKLFFEIHHTNKKWSLVIFGAGHISQELTRVLLRLDCQIICIDNRAEWLEKLPSSSKLEKVYLTNFVDYIEKIKTNDFVVIMTMGHSTDLPILEKLFNRKIKTRYVGVIGSDIKAKKLRKNILEAGFSEYEAESFFCPIGEEIGNNTPAEMAISIVAQLLKVRDLDNLKGSEK